MDNMQKIVYKLIKNTNMKVEYHFHINYEILFVSSGSISLSTNGVKFTLSKNTLCVIPPYTPHITEYHNADVKRIVFDSLYIDKYIKSIPPEFKTAVSISGKSDTDEIISSLIEEITLYQGESAYIYLYKLISRSATTKPDNTEQEKLIFRLIRYIELNIKGKLSLDAIADEFGVTKFHICRLFKKELGITPVEYITFSKIHNSVKRLKNTNHTITRISNSLSFYSPKYFTKIFKNYFGISPSEFRNTHNLPSKDLFYIKSNQNSAG